MAISFLSLSNSPKITDDDWLANCFMLSAADMEVTAYNHMMFSSADWKFTDTRIGGNVAINNPPAYTRFADPKAVGVDESKISASAKSSGLGEYWSEQIDDSAQIIHVQFGVPVFRGMLSFFAGVSNLEAGLFARTGRKSPFFYIGKLVGFVVGLRLLPLIMAGTLIKFLTSRTGSRYYNMKPTMHSYWNRVNFIANMMAVSEGLVDKPASGEERYSPGQMKGENFQKALDGNGTALEPTTTGVTRDIINAAHVACPELFLEDGGVDVFHIASRYQTLANNRREYLDKISKESNEDKFLERIIDHNYTARYRSTPRYTEDFNDGGKADLYVTPYGSVDFSESAESFDKKIAELAANVSGENPLTGDVVDPSDGAQETGGTDQTNPETTEEGAASGSTSTTTVKSMDGSWQKGPDSKPVKQEGWFSEWWNTLGDTAKAGYDGAFSWVAFKVNATGSVSASFSNQTGTPEIKSAINSFSSMAAKSRFNFSQGATGIGILDGAVKAVHDTLVGFAAGVDLMGLISLAGSSFIDIPDTWEDSSANLPTESYDIHLRTPYGNALSRYINISIPLSMLLAGALPISTGRQTYAAPYICKLISVGRSNMDLAMIDSLSVTHGVGNLGYTREGKPLQVDISLSFKDLNRSLHAPVDTGGLIINPLNAMSIFDDDSNFNYYINTLAGVSVADQVLATRRLERNIKLKMMHVDSFFTSGNLTLAIAESAPGRFLRSAGAGIAWANGGVFENLNRLAPGLNRIQ